MMDFANNPFFIYEMSKLCAVCNKKFDKNKSKHSLFDAIPKLTPIIRVSEVLESISDFNSDQGPQNLCSTCFNNTIAAYKFRTLCNNAYEKLTNYLKHQEQMQQKKKIASPQDIKTEDVYSSHATKLIIVEADMEVTENTSENIEIVVKSEANCNTIELEGDNFNNEVPSIVEEVSLDVEENGIDSEEEIIEKEPGTREETHLNVANIVEKVKFATGSAMSKRVTCKVCHNSYRADYISVHMRIHTGERPYQCKQCNKGFGTSTTLKMHEASHSDNRQFICGFCGRGFKLFRTLNIHERSHTGEKPYKCTHCDKAFTSTSRRKQHQLVHTGEKPFTCHLCAKSFTRLTILKDHLKSHAGVKDYRCEQCGNRFTQAHSLRNHLLKSCRMQREMIENTTEVTIYESETNSEMDIPEHNVWKIID